MREHKSKLIPVQKYKVLIIILYNRHGDIHRAIRHHRHKPSFTFITYGAEVLLVLTDSLHLRSVQYWNIVGHGLLSFLFVLFLSDNSTKSEDNQARRRCFLKLLEDCCGHLPGWQCSSSAEHGWCLGCRWQLCSWLCPSQQSACI